MHYLISLLVKMNNIKSIVFITSFVFCMNSVISWNEDYNNQYAANYFDNYYHRFQPRNFQHHYPNPNNFFDRPYQKCQCMKVKFCQPILNQLANAPKPLSPNLIADVRGKSCGYEGNDPLVCCPLEIRSRRNSYGYDDELDTTTTEQPWVWDVEKNPTYSDQNNYDNRKNTLFDNFNYDWEFYNFKHNDYHHRPHHNGGSSRNPRKKFFFFDFEDPRTFQNCPPSISDEFEMPDEFKHVKPVKNFHPIHVPTDELNPNVVTEIRPNADDKPLIFSTGIPPVATPPTPVDPSTLPDSKLALINSQSCGISINNRIIGGEDAGPGQFPWMARLAYRNKSSTLVSYRCAGSAISERYVITASHCVTNLIDSLELVWVRLGELDTRTNLCSDGRVCSEPQDFEIESVVHHPGYDTPKYANDIALIRIRTAFTSGFISPLCLPVGDYANADQTVIGSTGIIAGWGATTSGGTTGSPNLHWLRLPVVDTATCSSAYARFSANSRTPIIVGQGQLCVQGRSNVDACQGDSGGPLMSEGTPGSERYTLVGLVSFGPRTCGISNFPGVYTRLSAYMGWILENLKL